MAVLRPRSRYVSRADIGRENPVPDLAALTRHAVKVLPEGELERKLALGRPLRVKLGIDPTAPTSTSETRSRSSGCARSRTRATPGVLIVGDYTARVGDPSGRSKERQVMSDERSTRTRARYFEQA